MTVSGHTPEARHTSQFEITDIFRLYYRPFCAPNADDKAALTEFQKRTLPKDLNMSFRIIFWSLYRPECWRFAEFMVKPKARPYTAN